MRRLLAIATILLIATPALAALRPTPTITVQQVTNAHDYLLVAQGPEASLGDVSVYCQGGRPSCIVWTSRLGWLNNVSARWVNQGTTADLDLVGYTPYGGTRIALVVEGVPW